MIFSTIAFGAAALLLFRGINHGILSDYREMSIHSRYGHGTLFKKGYHGTETKENAWKGWFKNADEILPHLTQSGLLQDSFPRLGLSGLIGNGTVSLSGLGMGVKGVREAAFFDRLKIIEGHPLDGSRGNIFIGKGLAQALNVKLGQSLSFLTTTVDGSVNMMSFVLVGVFETGVKAVDDVSFKVELEDAQVLLDTQAIESVAVALKPGVEWEDLKASLWEKNDVEFFSFEELDQINYVNGVRWLKGQSRIFELIILVIILLGIFNAVTVSVAERCYEFSVARANGEKKVDILRLLFTEMSLLGAGSAICGVILVVMVSRTFLANGIAMPPAPGMTLGSQITVSYFPNDILTITALCLITLFISAVLGVVRVLHVPIAKGVQLS